MLSIPVVAVVVVVGVGGVGVSVVVVVGGGGGGEVQRIVQFPPLEPFLASVTTLMLKSLLTLALYSFFSPFLLQSLRNNMLHKMK